jgi:hypothetical protein
MCLWRFEQTPEAAPAPEDEKPKKKKKSFFKKKKKAPKEEVPVEEVSFFYKNIDLSCQSSLMRLEKLNTPSSFCSFLVSCFT